MLRGAGLWSVWLVISLLAVELCEGKLPVAPGLTFAELPSHIQDHLQQNGYKDTSVFMPDANSDKYLGVVESRPEHFPPPEMLANGVLAGPGLPGLELDPALTPKAWHAPLVLPPMPPAPGPDPTSGQAKKKKVFLVSDRKFKVVSKPGSIMEMGMPVRGPGSTIEMGISVRGGGMPLQFGQGQPNSTALSKYTQPDPSNSTFLELQSTSGTGWHWWIERVIQCKGFYYLYWHMHWWRCWWRPYRWWRFWVLHRAFHWWNCPQCVVHMNCVWCNRHCRVDPQILTCNRCLIFPDGAEYYRAENPTWGHWWHRGCPWNCPRQQNELWESFGNLHKAGRNE